MKILADLGTLDLSWSGLPLPIYDEKFGIAWHFEFELVWDTPVTLERKIWADLDTLDLGWSA